MNLKSRLPILDWLLNYNKKYFKGDLNAGITVGIMLIPQGMAYAMLAGLPPIYGLYAAIVPQLIYAILGTSRQLGVGPVAMDSLLVAVTVGELAKAGSDSYISIAILLAFLVGAIQLLLGFLRLGFLVNFLSHPVISGFTSAAALIIGFSQLKYLMGVDLERSQFLHEILWSAGQHLTEINPFAFAIGVGGIVLLLVLKRMKPAFPAPLAVVTGGIVVVWWFSLAQYDVAIVGAIPSGLPHFSIPDWNIEWVGKLWSSALTIALVAFMEAIAVAKAIHARHQDYKIVPNQELIALGMSNLVGSLFQSFPGTGGFSRSAVNDQAGAKTNLAAIISAVFIMCVLLFLTPLFFFLPKAVLASIIMVAVFKLISIQDAVDLWRKGYAQDFGILIITFLATLSIGIQNGILIGVLVSIVGMLYQSLHPTIRVEKQSKNLWIIHYKGFLYFGNSQYFKESMEAILASYKGTHLVLNGVGMSSMDSTGEKALESIKNTCQTKVVKLTFIDLPKSSLHPNTTSNTNLDTIYDKEHLVV